MYIQPLEQKGAVQLPGAVLGFTRLPRHRSEVHISQVYSIGALHSLRLCGLLLSAIALVVISPGVQWSDGFLEALKESGTQGSIAYISSYVSLLFFFYVCVSCLQHRLVTSENSPPSWCQTPSRLPRWPR